MKKQEILQDHKRKGKTFIPPGLPYAFPKFMQRYKKNDHKEFTYHVVISQPMTGQISPPFSVL
jgi:hypothetical protein